MLCAVVIDDDMATRLLITRVFEHSGKAKIVGSAINGIQGLEIIQALRPDFVILDQKMPLLCGSEMLIKLRAMPDFLHLPVFALTACADAESTQVLFNAGVNKVWCKPFDPFKLVEEMLSEFASS